LAAPETHRVKEIFGDALPLRGTDRAKYLDQACAGDAELRDEVEAYLSAAENTDAMLGDTRAPMEPFVSLAERPGTLVGRYKLLEQIGEGGFGVVFMAEQEQPVRRRVALKIIKLGMDTRQVIARFEAERQALAMMDHPNVAKVLDGGATETGRPYFVMELVKGTPITEYCDKNNLSIRARLELFAQVCQAVQHAHQKGLIHRDIKPSNVLVSTQDDKPAVKVIDFGIAKAMQARLTEKTLFTEFRQLIGTPEYMSPEQADGDLDIDTRSDVYSLGVLLYELLAGSPPFDVKQLLGAAFDEMQRLIREVDPPAPSTRLSALAAQVQINIAGMRQSDSKRLTQLLRGDLDWIVMRCLEKDRKRRYSTAGGLSDDLHRYLTDQPVEARQPTRRYRSAKFIRRHRMGVLAASAVVAALILGLSMATIGFIQARRQAAVARSEAARAAQVARFLQDMLRGVGPSVALGRDTTMLKEIVDRTADRVDRDLADQPEARIQLRQTLAMVYFDLGLYRKMEETARETLRMARAHFGEEHTVVADALSQLGRALLFLREVDESEAVYRQAAAMHRRTRGPDSDQEADALQFVADSLRHQGFRLEGPEAVNKLAEAEVAVRAALAIRIRRWGEECNEVAWSSHTLSMVLTAEGKGVEAETAARRSLAIFRKLHGDDYPPTANMYEHLGSLLMASDDRLDEAVTCLHKALEIQIKTEGDGQLSQHYSHFNLAEVLERQGKLVDSETHYRATIAIDKKKGGADYLEMPAVMAGLSSVLRKQGKLPEARAVAEEAFQLCQRLGGRVDQFQQQRAIEALKAVLTEVRDLSALAALDVQVAQMREARSRHLATRP
jgi:serine/threonine protein kinase/tetratricopeptide (TPR) repeat protein